jgi:hypothetical protein
MNQSKVSARYYLFEDVLWEADSFAPLRVKKPLRELVALAELVWVTEGGKGPCPAVRGIGNASASDFTTSGKRGVAGVIRLASKHQSLGGLLHELAHALGPNDKLTHGPAFRKRAIRLYKVYGGWSGAIAFDRPKEDY